MAESLPFYQRVGVLRPLQHRDFRLLWIGQTVSMVGDGIYVFAVAWFVYKDLQASPATFALVGFAWSAPQILLLLATGALSDRMDRRHLMIIGDLLRLVAITAIGTLILLDSLTVPLLIFLVLPYGAGQAIFGPAFNSIIPMIVPEEHLVQANSIGSTVRPLAWLVIGPAIGAVVVAAAGTGWAFLVDGLTFAVSALCIWMMHVRGDRVSQKREETNFWQDVREGIRYVGANRWLRWGLLGGMVSLFAVWGPWETLVPFVVTDQMHGTELQLALVFAAGGVGSVFASLVMAQRGLPKRPLTIMYISWGIGMGMTAFFGLVANIPQAMLVSLIAEGSIAVLIVIWFTAMQRLVPAELLGRVSSLDWMISILGTPASFLVVGPLARAFGADAVLIVAGVLGVAATALFALMPGALDPERDGRLAVSEPDQPAD